MNDLAALGAVLEHISVNIRLAAQTEVDEYSEPFKEGRKGSSIDPSKRNTDRAENACGLMRVVRANAGIELENVPTWRQRDISHSGPERIIVEDSFHLICFTLKRLNGIIRDLRINDESIKSNILMTQGVKAAPMVKTLLMEEGMDPDAAYKLVQKLAHYAWDNRQPFYSVLLKSGEFPYELKTSPKLKACFDEGPREEDIDAIFASYDV